MNRLKDKVAIVTGSARGIGKAIALQLAEEGCTVIISDLDETGAGAVAKTIGNRGGRAEAVKSDISNSADVDSLIEKTLNKFNQIDILVNNAGITRDTLLMRMKEEDWDTVMRVNLKGAFLCSKRVIRPMMRKGSGKIINIASIVGLIGNAGQANYAASKAGLIGLTKSMAKEVAAKNIQVNAIAPGYIETEMTANLPEEIRQGYLNNIPAGRAGTPEEIGHMVAFLASQDSNYITGQVITIDGGLVIA
jgi:3-oxoacyl-[acyl-carrier protein] reductase